MEQTDSCDHMHVVSERCVETVYQYIHILKCGTETVNLDIQYAPFHPSQASSDTQHMYILLAYSIYIYIAK